MRTFTSGAVAPKIVCVRPSTRTCTRTAAAGGTSTSAASTTAERLRFTESSFREGFVIRRAAGLLTRGALPCRLPGPSASGVSARKRLPSQRRDRPGLAPAFPNRTPWLSGGIYHRSRDRLEGAPALAARRPLGGAHLRALVDPAPRHGARSLGPHPPQVRAHDGVRGARGAARAGDW